MNESPRSWRRRPLLMAALAAMLAFSGCGGGGDNAAEDAGGDNAAGDAGHEEHGGHGEDDSPPAFEESAATTKIPVTLQDFAFVGLPASAKGPNVLFEATVKGGNQHELVVQDTAGGAAGVLVPFQAGKTKNLAVVLQPGTYTIVCLVKEGAKPHADLGMKAEIRVE